MARLLFILLFIPSIVFSHELKPSIANFQFIEKDNKLNFQLSIQLNLEAILANIDPSHSDTDESKNSDYYKDTFPGWEVVRLEGESWDKVQPFLETTDLI